MPVQIFYRKNNPVQISVLKRCMNEIMRYSKRERALLELNLVGLKKIFELNKKYLKRSKITDVISFPLDIKPLSKEAPWHLGEIFIATEVAKRQAKQAKRSLNQQIVRLAVHGFVHLQGIDHKGSVEERAKFERIEKRYLQHLNRKGLLRWDGLLQF